MSDSTPGKPAEVSANELLPVKVDVLRVVEIGIAIWAIALVVTLVIPALHRGGRDWWPWVCVAGVALGCVAWAYLKRGRGNAAAA